MSEQLGGSLSRRSSLQLLVGFTIAAVSADGWRALFSPAAAADECHVEWPVVNLLDCPNRKAHPGPPLATNGCGPSGTDFPSLQNWGTVNFTPHCDVHDQCYGTCNSDKAACDREIGVLLRKACTDSGLGPLTVAWCLTAANAYELAMKTPTAKTAYENAQKQACQCCRTCPKCTTWRYGGCTTNAAAPCGKTCCDPAKCRDIVGGGGRCCLRTNSAGQEKCCVDDAC